MSLQYQLKQGQYHLYDLSTPASVATGEHKLRLMTDTVALAFDMRTGKLHEHGQPSRIHSWASNTRRRLRAAGDLDERRLGQTSAPAGRASGILDRSRRSALGVLRQSFSHPALPRYF